MGVPLENSLSNPLKACRDRIVKMEEIVFAPFVIAGAVLSCYV